MENLSKILVYLIDSRFNGIGQLIDAFLLMIWLSSSSLVFVIYGLLCAIHHLTSRVISFLCRL